jgi:hypothetical protein
MLILAPPESTFGLDGYATRELLRLTGAREVVQGLLPKADAVVLGTRGNNPALAGLLDGGFLAEPGEAQGYAMRCGPHPADPRRRVLAIAGADPAGALYALRDLEHYHPAAFSLEPFQRAEHPRIPYRGHWTWGCNMPDKRAWIENMSRWKLNELIHWDNFPPASAADYVAFAHERGVRVVWGFGWGWIPSWNFTLPADFDAGVGEGVEMCGSSAANRAFFRREIARKVRDLYAPTGCDGIYFQAFTECPKCQCPRCSGRTMGELMLDFVNPIVDDLKREFPHLWISCGIHADFGDFAYLKELDPRCNIFWENCEAGVSVRGDDEDFGYIYKSIPYGHGYSVDCPADPAYTENSLREWLARTAEWYVVPGGVGAHRHYLANLQRWAARFLGKPSRHTHASVVADHSLFCRRTPFPHAALAEAQWDPFRDTAATVDGLLDILEMPSVRVLPDPPVYPPDPAGKPPWLVTAGAEREGHAE